VPAAASGPFRPMGDELPAGKGSSLRPWRYFLATGPYRAPPCYEHGPVELILSIQYDTKKGGVDEN